MFENESRRPHVKSGPVKLTKGYARKLFFKRMFNTIVVLSIVALVAGSIYVYIKQPIKTANGYITAKPIYETIEHGERVIVTKDKEYNLFTPLKRAIVNQDVYKVRIIAGPYGKIEKSKDKSRVTDGVNVISVNLSDSKKFLDMEYVAREINEEDEPVAGEKDMIVNKNQVLGTVK